MIKSLRARLLVWQTLLLVAVVGGFGGILFTRAVRAKLQEVDSQLEAAALYLEANLRGIPPHEIEGKPPPKKGGKDGPKDRPKDKGPFGELVLPRQLDGPPDSPEEDRLYFVVWRPNGSVMKSLRIAQPPELAFDDPAFTTRPEVWQEGPARVVRIRGPRGSRILVGKDVTRERNELRALAWQIVGVGLGVLLVGCAGGTVIASRLVKPLASMAATASAISATQLSGRIETAPLDSELAALGDVLNAMFERLEAAFARQQQFTADASHELRTPLAILRSHAELALSLPRSEQEYRDTIRACIKAADRMTALVRGLLTLARADAGSPGLHFELVAFDEIVAECVDQLRPLAQEKQLTLDADLQPAEVRGIPENLAEIASNLLSNAIQHNRPGGAIHVRLTASPTQVTLTVSDTGLGVPEADRPHLFERFYRVDKARTRTQGGVGLGLAICKSLVELHGGQIDFETKLDEGTTFRVTLPAHPGELTMCFPA
jgi:two-component system OmpR family sensor kinase